jgi:hypothetical protein
MALLIPAAWLLVGTGVLLFEAWRDPEFRGSWFAAVLYLIVFCGPFTCLAQGAWGLVRTGVWQSISIAQILAVSEMAGFGASVLREPAPWTAVQLVNEWYLKSNVGWTLLFVPGVLIGIWHALSKRASRRAREMKRARG